MNASMTLKITDDSGVEHIYDGHAALFAVDLTSQNNRLRAENAELRAVLERFRQGYCNLLELRVCADGRVRLTREEITEELRRVESILGPQVANNATNPPETPGERATGHESAGIEVGE